MDPSRLIRFFRTLHRMLTWLGNMFYRFIFLFFMNLNLKIRSKLPLHRIETETTEHVASAVKVFKWIVLPASLLYLFSDLYFFGRNALNFIFWGKLIFFYSTFLPDLPSIFRHKNKNEPANKVESFRKYALLLLAPLLIWALFSGVHLNWRTSDNFHNLTSLGVYGFFLLLLSQVTLGGLPFNVGDFTLIASLPLYGIAGYLAHLKVDKIL